MLGITYRFETGLDSKVLGTGIGRQLKKFNG